MKKLMAAVLIFLAAALPASAEKSSVIEEKDISEITDIAAEEEIAPDTDAEVRLIFAAESPLMCSNDEIINVWERPFVYNETTYMPLRIVTERLGGTVEYDEETRNISALYNGSSYSVNADDERIRVYNGVSFVPVREMCNSLGMVINWYDGIITVSDTDFSLTAEEEEYYKEILEYGGFIDAFFTPRRIVNPYVTYSYEQMNSDIALLSQIYPELISVYSIGKTTEGRDITAFRFGRGETQIIMCGAMHAREHIASNFLMYMTDTYALAYANNESRDGYNFREMLDEVSFIIIPMVNPDGINLVQNGYDSTENPDYVKSMPSNIYGHRGWKATVNGVDLNNNFDCLWYAKGSGPSYSGYGGQYAACEPETQAMQKLIDETDFKVFASFHTQGQVIYWMDPNCNQELIPRFEPHIERICRETGFDKMPSDGSYGVSGYMTDYVRYYKQAMAMTLELCPYIGDYPYPESDFDTVAYPVRNIGLILADVAKNL